MSVKAVNLDLRINPELPKRLDYRIGCLGAGSIMKNIQLTAYKNAGFNLVIYNIWTKIKVAKNNF